MERDGAPSVTGVTPPRAPACRRVTGTGWPWRLETGSLQGLRTLVACRAPTPLFIPPQSPTDRSSGPGSPRPLASAGIPGRWCCGAPCLPPAGAEEATARTRPQPPTAGRRWRHQRQRPPVRRLRPPHWLRRRIPARPPRRHLLRPPRPRRHRAGRLPLPLPLRLPLRLRQPRHLHRRLRLRRPLPRLRRRLQHQRRRRRRRRRQLRRPRPRSPSRRSRMPSAWPSRPASGRPSRLSPTSAGSGPSPGCSRRWA